MNKHHQTIKAQIGLFGVFGILLTCLPAIATPRTEAQQLLSQNTRPSIFSEPPYNGSLPSPEPVLQPPPPEAQGSPSSTITPINSMVNVRLTNTTGANISYEVIGETEPRSLSGKSNVLLQDLKTPVTVTFKRADSGLLMVTTKASVHPGTLEVTFKETTDLGTDKTTINIQKTGAVFLN